MIFSITQKIEFEQNCRGYLKHAADANTVELAKTELKKSLEYLESKGLTKGSTHWMYSTPACDLDFWYANLNAAADELDALPSDASPLVVSNQLMKLRESIVDQKEKGPRVTLPPNITIYPYQMPVSVLTIIGLSGLAIGSIVAGFGLESSKGCGSQ
jgi:hypothetical protein